MILCSGIACLFFRLFVERELLVRLLSQLIGKLVVHLLSVAMF